MAMLGNCFGIGSRRFETKEIYPRTNPKNESPSALLTKDLSRTAILSILSKRNVYWPSALRRASSCLR